MEQKFDMTWYKENNVCTCCFTFKNGIRVRFDTPNTFWEENTPPSLSAFVAADKLYITISDIKKEESLTEQWRSRDKMDQYYRIEGDIEELLDALNWAKNYRPV